MPRQRLLLCVLLASAVVPYFVNLGASSIWDANEAFYVQTPREMLDRGDLVSPTFNFLPRLNKPVLSYWIVAAFYAVFGVSVAVQRIPIAIAGLVLVLTAFSLARAGSRGPSGRDAPLWAALGLAVAPRLLMFARRIFIDIYVSMFMGLTLLFFALSERYPDRRRPFLLLMYVSVGLGMLTKGPVALVLPGLAFVVYLVAFRELRRVRDMMLPSGSAVVLAIVVPWYAALYARYGWTHITSFFIAENVERFTEGVGVQASRGPFFYLPVVFADAFPWSLCLFGAAALWVAGRRQPMEGADGAGRVRALLWIWILTIVAFFSLSAAKQDLYVFPIVPAVAALAGLFVADAERGPWLRMLRTTAAGMGLVLVAGGGAAIWGIQRVGDAYALDGVFAIGALGAVGGLAAMAIAVARSPRAALAAVALTLVVLNWVFVVRLLPAFERFKPAPSLSAAAAARLKQGDIVAHYNVALPSMVYYLNRPIVIAYDEPTIREIVGGDRTVYAVLPDADYEALQAQFGVRTCVITRAPYLKLKLRELLAKRLPPEVLLITNRCGP